MNEQQIQNHVNQLNATINQLDQDNAVLVRMLNDSKGTISYYRQVIDEQQKRITELESVPEPVQDPE
ncbi:hypothetical protein D3C75_185500 [compost metagenome]